MKRIFLTTMAILASWGGSLFAQREQTPVLDRGLVAVMTADGVFCSWRIPGEEYYDVSYNIYRDGTKLNDKPLAVSNFSDPAGTASSQYSVAAVVRGVEFAPSSAVQVMAQNYLLIKPTHDGKCTYQPNDATIADLDGDGEMELIVKFVCTDYHWGGYKLDATEFDIIEAYKLNGKRLWWIDCGPNMTDFQSNEINIACYDWDGDGKAECILRAADNTVLHKADGSTQVIGDPKFDSRNTLSHEGGQTFTHSGAEFLLYLNGETAEPYVVTDFPLRRLEDGETNLEDAWGDGYGHRSSKFFFGAPYFDGHKPSIFLARGIYTRHKMIAFDVDPATHTLTERWRWFNNTGGPWYGQGYHNYTIADVDWDGRDEIVFGSMVIDDNGKGLSTTGLGHGDAHHVGDFNPYVHGSEIFACNEDEPQNNYRDATTSKIYYRSTGSADDGRSICGKFTDDIIGAAGITSKDGGTLISCVQNGHAAGTSASGVEQNFRIYWDGDLCEETFNYTSGKNTTGGISKNGKGVIQRLTGSMTNNDTKGTPCLQADIFGDWREEVVMRDADNNIRIFTTTTPTKWRNYTLLDDHQYRNAMITQMNGYNQPPHTSYFLGEAEGITIAPPPVIMTGRVRAVSAISADMNGKHVVVSGNENLSVSVADGAAPYILTVNTPSWVQGCFDNNNIKYDYFTHTFTGNAFTGNMRLVKQGDGVLVLPNVEQTYSGNTDLWAGTFAFDGKMTNSPVWLNRFASLSTSNGVFVRKVSADYGATIDIAGVGTIGSAQFDTLVLNFGAKLRIDIKADMSADFIKTKKIVINKAPNAKFDVLPFTSPVFELNMIGNANGDIPSGKYLVAQFDKIEGDLNDIFIDGTNGKKCKLVVEDNNIYLEVVALRQPGVVYWSGEDSNVWDLGESLNFIDEKGNKTVFVTGDKVIFDDNAKTGNVVIAQIVAPASVVFNNSKIDYAISGDSIVGAGSLSKNGSASLAFDNVNHYTGGSFINDGVVVVKRLANIYGDDFGALAGLDNFIVIDGSAVLEVKGNVRCNQRITMMGTAPVLNVPNNCSLSLLSPVLANSITNWFKKGAGSLTLSPDKNQGVLHVVEGWVYSGESGNSVHSFPDKLILEGGNIKDVNNVYSYSTSETNITVPGGASVTWYRDSRCNYLGSLSGEGTITVKAAGTRDYSKGDWSAFSGIVNFVDTKENEYFYFLNNKGMEKARANLSTTVEFNEPKTSTYYDAKFGSLSGSGNIIGGGNKTLYVGARNENTTYSGVISNFKVVKTGSGALTLTNIHSTVANVVISSGTLHLAPSNTSTKVFGESNIEISENATLSGSAKVANVSVYEGGVLAPGKTLGSVAAGCIAADKLVVSKGSLRFNILNFNDAATSKSYVTATDIYAESGTVEVVLGSAFDVNTIDEKFITSSLAKAIKNGKNSATLWSAKSAVFPKSGLKLVLPKLPAGYVWDTSSLFQKEGVIRVLEDPNYVANAISTVFAASESVDVAVYDLRGNIVSRFSALRSDVESLARQGLDNGLYVVRMAKGNMFESIKILVD